MPSLRSSSRGASFAWIAVAPAVLLAFAGIALTQEPPAASAPPPFTFSQVDLELLEKSNELDRQIAQRGLVYQDAGLTDYLNAVAGDVLPPEPDPVNVRWQLHVLRDPIPNAFALPNGSIYVHSGLLALLENEAQLASVLAHEESHVIYRHPYLGNRSYRKKALAANILSGVAAAGGAAGGIGSAAGALLGVLAPSILDASIYGYSRELEKQADLHAVTAINTANYSTEEMVIVFKLLDSPHEVDLSSHFYQDQPKLTDRIGYLSDAIEGMHAPTAHPLVQEEQYMAAVEQVSRDNIALDIAADRQRTAVATAERLVKKFPKSAENYRVQGDAFRALGARTPDPTPEERTSHGKGEERKALVKLTPQEYEAKLMASDAGKAAWDSNRKQSEDAYRKALELDPADAAAHRGLGFLYEREQLPAPGAEEFQKYLELAPNAFDQAQIHRHLENDQRQAASGTPPATP